jgi:hypothetical protein
MESWVEEPLNSLSIDTMASRINVPQEALDIDVSRIDGSAATETKQLLVWHLRPGSKGFTRGFAEPVGNRLQVKHVSLTNKAVEPEKVEARVVYEIVVDAGMSQAETIIFSWGLLTLFST